MPSLRPVLLVNGVLLLILSAAMLIPAMVDMYQKNPDAQVFLSSAFFTAFIGGGLFLTNRGYKGRLSMKQAFILTNSCWVMLTLFASLPLYFSELNLSLTDAVFETLSGITTTGATVLTGLQKLPPGILVWRCLLQWLGGIGIIVLAMAILPILHIGGMQLFRTESSDRSDKILPSASQIAATIGAIYLFLTSICALCLWLAGMRGFDAICHAMTTIATAGFANYDASIGHFRSAAIETIIICFMLLSALPFILYYQLMRGRPRKLFTDMQVRWFVSILTVAVLSFTVWLWWEKAMEPLAAFRAAAFNITSMLTTTGYASTDYSAWGNFAITGIFLLFVMGGCTGSTTGGIKVFRYQVLFEIAKAQVSRVVQPHGVFLPRFNGKPIEEIHSTAVQSFFILFAFCFICLATILSFFGLDFLTSMSGAAAMLANVGPGLGEVIGPGGNYTSLPDGAKWALMVGMLVGRLEVITVLVLFSPHFWRD